MSTAAIVVEATGDPVGSLSFSGKQIGADGPVATSMVDAARRRRLSDAEIWEFFDGWSNGYLVAQPEPTTAAAGPDLTGAELAEFNRLHPRDRKGKFADHIGDAIASGVPARLDEFTREQLRNYATKKRGLVLPRGASVEVIKERLMKSAGKQVGGAVAAEQGPLPDRASLLRMRVPELRELAKTHGVKVSAKARKVDIVDALSPAGPVQVKPGIPEVTTPKVSAPVRNAAPAAGDVFTPAGRERANRELKAHVESGIIPGSEVDPGMGVSAVTRRLQFEDGSFGYRKVPHKGTGEKLNDEYLSNLVMQAVGAPSPGVYRQDDRTLFMENIPGRLGRDLTNDEREAVLASAEGRLIGLADAIAGSSDREPYSANIILTPDGHLVAIDNAPNMILLDSGGWKFQLPKDFKGRPLPMQESLNSFAERWIDAGPEGRGVRPKQGSELKDETFLRGFDTAGVDLWRQDNDLTSDEHAQIRQRLEALRPEFVALKKGKQLDYMIGRLDAIAAVSAAQPESVAIIPSYKPPAGVSVIDQKRADQLIRRDPQIFATTQERFGGISTSGNLSAEDAAWLQSVFEREPAFINRLAQEAQIKRHLGEQAKKAGQTPSAYQDAVASDLKTAFADKPIVIRVTDEAAVRGILRQGRFRTQFDAGTKRAPGLTVDLAHRRLGEQILGVDPDTPPDRRPVYGYVAINGVEPALSAGKKIPGIAQREGQEDVLSSYGQVQIILKPGVRQRTTATVGDSLDEIGFMRPSPVDNPTAESVGFRDLADISKPGWTRSAYVEAQVHGGVAAGDIAEVVFPSAPDAETKKSLSDAGIPWRVLTNQPAPDGVAAARGFEARISNAVKEEDALRAAGSRATEGSVQFRDDPGLTNDQERQQYRALSAYRRDARPINGYLRTGEGSSPEIVRHVEAIDDVLSESPLSSDTELWRGLQAFDDAMTAKLATGGSLVGYEWADKGFSSATARRRFAETEGNGPSYGEPGVVMRILAPKGLGGVQLSTPTYEAEVLLPRGLRFRVVADHGLRPPRQEGVGLGFRRLDVEIVPETPTPQEVAATPPVLRRSSNPIIENRGEAIHAAPGSVAYHPDGQIGYAIQRMGDDKSIEVEGDALANVLGRTLTDSVTGRITPRQELDRLKEIVAQVLQGTKAREVLDDALRTIDAPRVPAPDVPAATPAPLRQLIEELADMPQMYNGTVRRQRNGSELARAVELARRWGAGDLHRLELLQGVEGLFNQRHESEEGKFSIDRAVRKASADLNAIRRELVPPVTAGGGLSGDALEEFNRLHPRGFGGRFGHKTGVPGSGRAAVLAGDFRGLTRVGGQLGFNRAALFEDSSGQKWYVKAQQSVDHANNEALAAALYRKASVIVPEVHTGSGAPNMGDGPQTASEWMDLEPANKSDRIFRRDVHGDFGVHAWLANWDAAGAGGRDNIEVEAGTPFPVLVDAGGALLYRGAGGPKGDMFGDEVFEFDTLRDPRYNPTASKLFTDMTPPELAQAAERVEKVTPKQIRDLVAEYDMPPSLAERLIARQKDIVKRGDQIRLDLDVQADPDRKSGRAALAAAGSRLSDRPAGQTYDTAAELTFAEDPGWSDTKRQRVADILRWYRTRTYRQIGEYQRGQSDMDEVTLQDSDEEGNPIGPRRTEKIGDHIAYMHDAFAKSPLQAPVLLYRGVQDGERVWGDAWRPDGDMVGVEWTELSPTSTSASESVGKIFESDALMRLHVPAGVGGIQLQGWRTEHAHTREAELLLQPGLRYRIVGDHSTEETGWGTTFKKRVFDVVVEAIPDDGQ